MNSVLAQLFVIFASLALCTIAVLMFFKYTMKWLGMTDVQKEGVLLTATGIEYVGFMWLIKLKANYTDVESVELIPYHKAWLRSSFLVGNCRWLCKRVASDVVAIRLKGGRKNETLLLTPEDPALFISMLRSKLSSTH
jgi:hypothetical protein